MLHCHKKVVHHLSKETIGYRIKEKRKSKGITQKEFSKKLNKSGSTIQKYESGEIEIPHSVIEEIARILDTTVPYLLGYEEVEKTLDELRIFKQQLDLLGCQFDTFYCAKEDDPNVVNCTLNGIVRYCHSCDIRCSCCLLTYNNTTVKVPYNEYDDLRKHFKAYMQFMLLELIKKYK